MAEQSTEKVKARITKKPRQTINANIKAKAKPKTNTRSRTGCVTCKAKHSKCDETKPECLMCVGKGLKCGGYDRGLRWSSKHQRKLTGHGPNHLKDANPGQGSFMVFNTGSTTSGESPQPTVTDIPDFMSAVEDVDWAFATGQSFNRPSSSSISSGGIDYAMEGLDNIMTMEGTTSDIADLQQPWLQMSEMDKVMDLPSLGNENLVPDNVLNMDQMTGNVLGWLDFNGSQPAEDPLGASMLPPTIRDVPSLLIDNWFRQVCSVWSAYDSDTNFFKKLAGNLWTKSEAVSTCLQSMSAALLTEQIPHMRPTALHYMKQAMKAVQAELAPTKNVIHFDTLPSGLLLSLFCVGTTICWIDARQLGIPFLREAKALLGKINQQALNLSMDDRKLLAFFNKSLIYWDMLIAVVREDEDHRPESTSDPISRGQMSLAIEKETNSSQIIPHPWTGISTVTSQLFAQAIRLCRNFRHNARYQRLTARSLRTALSEIEKAQEIEEKLLELEHPNMASIGDTGDQRTTGSHLLEVAEAYRLAALLQLYQTFPDLVAIRLPSNIKSYDGQVPWNQWIIPLTFRLIKTLEQIPPKSGSRMLQPILYITASTGLKLEIPVSAPPKPSNANERLVHSSYEKGDISEYIDQFLGIESKKDYINTLSQMSLDVGNARRFVMERLNILENTLPPKPIVMAKTLVKAVWNAYDSEAQAPVAVHWIDIMEDQDLRSIFG